MSMLHLAISNDETNSPEKLSQQNSIELPRSGGEDLGLTSSAVDAGLLCSSDTMDSSSNHFMGIISKKEFSFGLGLLEKHKKWAQKAARK